MDYESAYLECFKHIVDVFILLMVPLHQVLSKIARDNFDHLAPQMAFQRLFPKCPELTTTLALAALTGECRPDPLQYHDDINESFRCDETSCRSRGIPWTRRESGLGSGLLQKHCMFCGTTNMSVLDRDSYLGSRSSPVQVECRSCRQYTVVYGIDALPQDLEEDLKCVECGEKAGIETLVCYRMHKAAHRFFIVEGISHAIGAIVLLGAFIK